MSLKSFVSYVALAILSACSGGLGGSQAGDGDMEACVAIAMNVCREVTPGVFKNDQRGVCGGEYENEVPLAFCQPGIDRQAELREEITRLDRELGQCVVDSDCELVQVTASCAFGCFLAKNVGADASLRKELVAEYDSYSVCEAKACAPVSPTFFPPRCLKGQCQAAAGLR